MAELNNRSIFERSLDLGNIPWRSLAKSTVASGPPTGVTPALIERGDGSIVECSLDADDIP